jgi:hypothetical protein
MVLVFSLPRLNRGGGMIQSLFMVPIAARVVVGVGSLESLASGR